MWRLLHIYPQFQFPTNVFLGKSESGLFYMCPAAFGLSGRAKQVTRNGCPCHCYYVDHQTTTMYHYHYYYYVSISLIHWNSPKERFIYAVKNLKYMHRVSLKNALFRVWHPWGLEAPRRSKEMEISQKHCQLLFNSWTGYFCADIMWQLSSEQ